MTGPQFRLSPGAGWNRAASTSGAAPTASQTGAFRNSRWDRPALAVSVNPSWLLAPLYVRDLGLLPVAPPEAGEPAYPGPVEPDPNALAAGLDLIDVAALTVGPAPAAKDWPAWWSGAMAYRPGTPAPRVSDLIAGSAALQALWASSEPGFDVWSAALASSVRQPEEGPRRTERAALAGFAARNGRDPRRWSVRILQIPVASFYLYSPEQRRIVVSQRLRHDAEAYPEALAEELSRHF